MQSQRGSGSGRIKAEVLQKILSDSEEAKHISGIDYAYTPEDYNKVRAKNLAMGLINDGESDRYVPHTGEGAIEFDQFGRLKKIARTAPKMLDLNRYTQNRYYLESISIPKDGSKMERPAGRYIVMVLGEPIVKAITAMNELPKTVRAYRFRFGRDVRPHGSRGESDGSEAEKEDWHYVGAEFIEDTVAYKMTKTLKPADALKLMQKIARAVNSDSSEFGDSLDDLAKKL